MRNLGVLLLVFPLTACVTTGATETLNVKGKPVPQLENRNSPGQLAKADLDRMADVEMHENTQSLRLLMTKLYKRNPAELKKSTQGTVDEMTAWVFEGKHEWKFNEINEVQGTEAIQLAFNPEYEGDRVLPFIVGLHTMLVKAHGGKTDFYLTDSIDPQSVYNAARNVEVAAWKLSTARDRQGKLYLLTNEINDAGRNLSFEREFGKIIGRLDFYAVTLAEKSQRMISRVAQGLASMIFIPF